MVVGILDVKLALRESRSLKDKRRVLNSLKDRLRAHHNVSVAEVEAQDMLQVAELCVCQVGSDARYVRGALEHVVQVVRTFHGAEMTDYAIDIVHR